MVFVEVYHSTGRNNSILFYYIQHNTFGLSLVSASDVAYSSPLNTVGVTLSLSLSLSSTFLSDSIYVGIIQIF